VPAFNPQSPEAATSLSSDKTVLPSSPPLVLGTKPEESTAQQLPAPGRTCSTSAVSTSTPTTWQRALPSLRSNPNRDRLNRRSNSYSTDQALDEFFVLLSSSGACLVCRLKRKVRLPSREKESEKWKTHRMWESLLLLESLKDLRSPKYPPIYPPSTPPSSTPAKG